MFVVRCSSFVVALFCLVSVYAQSGDEEAGIKEALRPFVQECADEFGITEEQFEEAKKNGNAGDIDPCFMSCFLKKAKFLDSQGKFDVDSSIAFVNDNMDGGPAKQFLSAVGEECEKINDEDVSDGDKGCDRAKMLFDCIVDTKKRWDD
ncbi:uncharacterized protein LOC118267988 isoform X2 [Spodoptera frugiperda]|uniref:Uncharacterized protein LOC118267988 isoform X1 n=1 Tax=Spodoptera frugiperda TaxID=7108 RepID=A0A9R0EU69_SPOFR|nr:uncharacterized protein LOC118267988 isoform X1 [Spodoptera frugiperda]XP_050550080.1 uncharacterized protein LOC118267988 isoform X2 [Spodoptera frugiperda]